MASMARPPGPPAQGGTRRSIPCATRPAGSSRWARSAAIRWRSCSSTPTATRSARWRAGRWRRRSAPSPPRAAGACRGQREPAGYPRAASRRAFGPGAWPRGPVALADGRARSLGPCGGPTATTCPAPVNGDIPHTEALYLVDRRGDERSGYLYPFNQGFVTHDLRVLGPRARASRERHRDRRPPTVLARARRSPAWRDYLTLTKPRIMSLLVLTSVCAMVAAARGPRRRSSRSSRSCSGERSPAAARARSTTCSTATSTG